MSIIDVDVILERLSSKFHKIFYDREFVCCVQEDLEVILKNRNRCCVVVFPALGPNYLKAVQYQAKIFDLEVFTLGSGKICSIAVCDKKFLIKKDKENAEQIMPSNEQECGAGSTLKKKRPERQLYIPPAQRRLPINELPQQNNQKSDEGNSAKPKKHVPSSSTRKRESQKKMRSCDEAFKTENIHKLSDDPIKDTIDNKYYEISQNYSFLWWKYALFEPPYYGDFSSSKFTMHFRELLCNREFDGDKIFSLKRKLVTLHILCKDYVVWQPKINVLFDKKRKKINLRVIPRTNLEELNLEVDTIKRLALAEIVFKPKTYLEILENYTIYCDFDVYWIRKDVEPYDFLDECCGCYYYAIKKDISDETKLFEEFINELLLTENCHDKIELEPLKVPNEEEMPQNNVLPVNEQHEKEMPQTDVLPVNEKRKPADFHLQKNVLNNNSSKNLNYLKNSINVSENVKKEKTDLEEEKEIMRKTKENINRKTRPIIKYVDDGDDTLKIEKNDVNNWEDLFDEEGQLQDDLLKEIVHKVGNDVNIIKAKEDYSDYFSKHVNIEELEHMVELYDFPSTLETHDLIHAFSEIKSDAMYVKWVDDTHAILVLGSSSQAQRAINVQNPLIKVRPMTAASKSSLSTAYRNDLKPALKRPPTNLQTARRLITTHLGTKSGISKEHSAKERDDLKAAREMKKLVKKNERDAWEGNLRSSMS